MKFLTAIITLAASTAFSTPKTEVIQIKTSISLSRFVCEIGSLGSQLPMNERLRTVLEKPQIITTAADKAAIKLVHTEFTTQGCELTALDQIAMDAHQHFGYLMSVPVTITKETSGPIVFGFGECFGTYTEKVELDLGHNTILKSEAAKRIKLTDCKS